MTDLQVKYQTLQETHRSNLENEGIKRKETGVKVSQLENERQKVLAALQQAKASLAQAEASGKQAEIARQKERFNELMGILSVISGAYQASGAANPIEMVMQKSTGVDIDSILGGGGSAGSIISGIAKLLA